MLSKVAQQLRVIAKRHPDRYSKAPSQAQVSKAFKKTLQAMNELGVLLSKLDDQQGPPFDALIQEVNQLSKQRGQ